jgi:hypothetical protein
MATTDRRKQIKKCGSEYVLFSADGKKRLARSKTLSGALAAARKVYSAHGTKRRAKRSKTASKPVRGKRVKRVNARRATAAYPTGGGARVSGARPSISWFVVYEARDGRTIEHRFDTHKEAISAADRVKKALGHGRVFILGRHMNPRRGRR